MITKCLLVKISIIQTYDFWKDVDKNKVHEFFDAVENKKNAIEILEKNIEKLNLKKNTKIFYNDVLDLIKKNFTDIKFNLIFFDPPFKDDNINELIELIASSRFLDKNSILIFHRKKDVYDKFPSYVKILDERTYGLSKLIFGKILF